MSKDIRSEIEEMLTILVEMRGRHSNLWMHPKSQSLNEAADKVIFLIKQVCEDTVGVNKKINKSKRFSADERRYAYGYNQAIKEMKAKLKEILG